jgi:amino acid adenylation domain-containing protein
MDRTARQFEKLPPKQQAIRAKCFHPTGTFVEFEQEDIEQSIPERFEEIVRRYPDRLAIKTKTEALSYATLNGRANRIARSILGRCGEGNVTVAILLEHGASTVATILAVLKAGKLYVPLDPTHPPSRIAHLLQDSQARLIVTNNKNLHFLTGSLSQNCSLVNLDELDEESSDNLGLQLSPDWFAYVRYTSGSTGEPKGVLEKHRNLLHVVMREANTFHLCVDDRLTFLGSWGKHLFRGLLTGASLLPVNVREEGLGRVARWLGEERITILHATSTLFRQLIDTLGGEETFPDLRLIRLAGEPASKREFESYKNHFSSRCILVNELASTEAGGITAYFVDKRTEIQSNIIPVGYPLDGIQVQLLNEEGEKVGSGEIGEITVKSRYLFPGYWGQPTVTAAFLTNSNPEEERLFRTGDLGIMHADGCIVHLGRKDFQIKIRGLRVELAEVEATLGSHPAICEVVVEAGKDKFDENRLIAYIVCRQDQAVTVPDIRRFLKARLPDYMLPSTFMFLDAIPLTSNGKVDRRFLPDPGKARPELNTPYIAPTTPMETEIGRIWADILCLDRIGIHDNFIDLGGHSLAATRVVSRVLKKFHLEISLQCLFQSPTVAEMAAVITESQAKKLGEEDINAILTQLESLSDEDAKRLLNNRGDLVVIRDKYQ